MNPCNFRFHKLVHGQEDDSYDGTKWASSTARNYFFSERSLRCVRHPWRLCVPNDYIILRASLTKEVSSSRTDLTEYRRSEPPGSGRRSAGEYRAPATLENATHTPSDTGPLSGLKDVWPSTEQESGTCDSVGCVALDMNGRTAVAVSTGGITGKLAGRLGDACVPGVHFWNDVVMTFSCSTLRFKKNPLLIFSESPIHSKNTKFS